MRDSTKLIRAVPSISFDLTCLPMEDRLAPGGSLESDEAKKTFLVCRLVAFPESTYGGQSQVDLHSLQCID